MFKEKLNRYVYRAKSAAEEVLIDDTRKPHNLSKKELWEKIWAGESKYERFTSFLRLVKDSLPKNLFNFDNDKLKDIFYHKEEVPFNQEKYKFEEKIGIGGQSRVYLLESQKKENSSMVLKVAAPDKERKSSLEQVKNFKKEYEYIRNIYKDVPELIPEEYFLVINDPFYKRKGGAAVMLQPFISGEIKDIFDFKKEELKELSGNNPIFGEQLRKFCSITLNHAQDNGETIDLLGPKNVSVVKNESGEKLVIMDPHVVFSTREKEEEKRNNLNNKLEFLSCVDREIK